MVGLERQRALDKISGNTGKQFFSAKRITAFASAKSRVSPRIMITFLLSPILICELHFACGDTYCVNDSLLLIFSLRTGSISPTNGIESKNGSRNLQFK